MRVEYDRIDTGIDDGSVWNKGHRYLYRARQRPEACCCRMAVAMSDGDYKVKVITEYMDAEHRPKLVVLHFLKYDCDDDEPIDCCPWCGQEIEHVEVSRLVRKKVERKEIVEVTRSDCIEVPEDSNP